MPMNVDALRRILRSAWSPESSTQWLADNPAAGQCGATAALAHDLLGGDVLKTRVGDAWHFYNRLEGQRQDLTASQFGAPISYDDVPSTRAEAMADAAPAQHEALRLRFHAARAKDSA